MVDGDKFLTRIHEEEKPPFVLKITWISVQKKFVVPIQIFNFGHETAVYTYVDCGQLQVSVMKFKKGKNNIFFVVL